MKSLYEVLGAHADDDAQAIKKAFRTAVKMHHPDLHPNDPEALVRFRRIVTANAILRDENQRAAYDGLLAKERRQIKVRLDRRVPLLQHGRRKTRLTLGAAAVVVTFCTLAGSWGLFMQMPTAALVDVVQNGPPTAKSASTVETIRKDQATASIAADAPTVTAAGSEGAAPAAGNATRSGGVRPARGTETAEALPALPKDAHFYRELGIVSYRIGDFPNAIVNLDEAIRLAPADALAHNIRGNAWDEMGAFESALADYDEAIRLDPGDPVVFHDRAVMWHRKGDLDKALVDLDRAVRFTFSDPNIYCDRGLIWYEKGSRARAVADFAHAVKLDPDFGAACISRGLILHTNGEFNITFADLEKTIRVSPSVFDVSRRVASRP